MMHFCIATFEEFSTINNFQSIFADNADQTRVPSARSSGLAFFLLHIIV